MRTRRARIIAGTFVGILMAGTVQAAPLTNFDTYRGTIDFGVWNTKASFDTAVSHYSFDAKSSIYGGITYGFDDRWGIQYSYHGINTAEKFVYSRLIDGIIFDYKAKIKGSTNEFNVLYSPGEKSRTMFFVGVNKVNINIPVTGSRHDTGEAISVNDNDGSVKVFQIGAAATAPLGKSVDGYFVGSVGGHSLLQAEVGITGRINDNLQANLGYRWLKVNDIDIKSAGNINTKTDIKTNGLTFGLTYLFGPKSKPVIVPPKVQVTEPMMPQTVEETKPTERIILKGVNFDFDQATLQPESLPVLNKVVDVAQKHMDWNFVLIGHTDGMGSDAYNMDLSQRRVVTVQKYLVGQGIAESRLAVDWKGKREPIATNETDEGRAQNRRVELIIK